MTTPQITLPRIEVLRGPVAPRLAYPTLMVGLCLALLGYTAVGFLLLRMLLSAF